MAIASDASYRIVAGAYVLRTGNKLRRVHAVLQHPQCPFMLANLDRKIVGTSNVQILECKTAGEFGARHWRDGVPDYVQFVGMYARQRAIAARRRPHANRRGFAEHDPTQASKGERRMKPVKHFAAFTDPDDVARLMRSIYDYKGTPEVRAALKLSAMLFQRPVKFSKCSGRSLILTLPNGAT